MVATFRAGILAETPANNGITRLCSRVLLKGTRTRTAAKIAGQIESLGGSFGADSGNNSMSVALRVLEPDVATGIEILSDILLNPLFPEREIALEKQSQITAIKAEDEAVTTTARNIMRHALFAGHPYSLRSNGSPETVAALTRDAIARFHRQNVVGKNGVIAIFGNVKAAAVKALATRLFASMPAGRDALASPPRPAPFTRSKTVRGAAQKSAGCPHGRLSRRRYLQPGPPGARADRRGMQRPRLPFLHANP